MNEQQFFQELAQRLDPKDPHAHNNMAVIFFRRGQLDDAIKELEKALTIDPNFEPARRNLEAVFRKTGRQDEVLGYYLEKAKQLPDETARRLAAAEALANMGRDSEALAEYMSVLQSAPEEKRALLGAASILRKRRDYRGAESLLKKVVEIDPDCAEAYRNLGEVHYNIQKLDLALKELEKARQLEPDAAETYYLLSFVYGENGMVDEALKAMEKAASLNPSLTEAEELLTIETEPLPEDILSETSGDPFKSRLELTEAYLSKGLFTDAEKQIALAKKFASNEQEQHKAMFAEALLYFLKKEYSTSMMVLKNVPALDTDALVLSSLNSYWMARPKLALQLMERAARTNDEFALLNYGVLLYIIKSDPQEAIAYLDRVKDLPSALYNKAYILLQQGKFSQAKDALDQYKELRGENVHYHNLLAEIARAQHDDQLAEKELLSALRIDPGFGDALVGLGAIYFARRNFPRFFEFMRQARAMKHYYRKDTLFMGIRGLSFDVPVEVPDHIPDPNSMEPSELRQLMQRFLDRGKYQTILTMADNLLKESPFDQKLIRIKAHVYFRSGRFRRARQYFSALEKLDEEDRVFWALSEEWLGNWPMALKHALSLLRDRQDQASNWAWVGRVLFRLRRFREAEMFFKKALMMDKQNSEALYWVGEMMLSAGRSDEVKNIAEHLIESADPRGFLFLGEMAFLSEKYDEAQHYLEKALSKGVDRAKVLYLMGLMAAIRGQYELAIKNWKEVENLAYDRVLSWKAKQNIAQLENMRAYLKSEVAKQGGMSHAPER